MTFNFRFLFFVYFSAFFKNITQSRYIKIFFFVSFFTNTSTQFITDCGRETEAPSTSYSFYFSPFFRCEPNFQFSLTKIIKLCTRLHDDAERARRWLLHDTIFISIMFMYSSLDNINNLNTSGSSGTNACIQLSSHFTNETAENFSHTTWVAIFRRICF